MPKYLRIGLPIALVALTAASCGGGSDGSGNPSGNHAPVIAGMPVTTVNSGSLYSFTPTASDQDSDPLSFSIAGKPSWAEFSTATGALTGTPTSAQTVTSSNIRISVSDGTASDSLPAFSITVIGPNSGSIVLTWSEPTQNTDGSSLQDLSGFKIYHGTSSDALNDIVSIAASQRSHTFTNLPNGTHYFALTALSSTGGESDRTTIGSAIIP